MEYERASEDMGYKPTLIETVKPLYNLENDLNLNVYISVILQISVVICIPGGSLKQGGFE